MQKGHETNLKHFGMFQIISNDSNIDTIWAICDISNCFTETKTDIQLSFQFSTKYWTLFDLTVTNSNFFFYKSGSSALTLTGAVLCFITTPFYTPAFLYSSYLYVGAIQIVTFCLKWFLKNYWGGHLGDFNET